MADTAFRKIDIDAYDEDVLQESELYEPDPREFAQVLGDAKQKAVQVRSSLAKCVVSSSSTPLLTHRLASPRGSEEISKGPLTLS
jgi:actin related protein 2/3 complex subunit 5